MPVTDHFKEEHWSSNNKVVKKHKPFCHNNISVKDYSRSEKLSAVHNLNVVLVLRSRMTSVTKAVVENHVTDDVGRQLSDISRQESNLSNLSNLSNASVVSELEKQQHEIEKQQSEIERQQQEMKKQQQEVERQQRALERQKSEMERQHREAMDKLEKEMLEMKMQMNQLKKSTIEVEELKEQMEKRLDTSSEASNDPDEVKTISFQYTVLSVSCMYSGGSRISQIGPPIVKMGGANLMFWPIFLENYMKMMKIGP